MADDLADAAALVFAQAQRQLQQQNTDIDALRTRAVAMLSVAALVAGLFGPRLQPAHSTVRTTVAVSVALSAFGISIILAILIAAPRRKWLFTFRLDQMLKLVDSRKAIPTDVTYNLARWMEEARYWNQTKLDRMHAIFSWLCLAMGVQVIAWGSAIL